MSIIRTGPGLRVDRKTLWVEGEEETLYEISLDGVDENYQQPSMFFEAESFARPGDVLMIDQHGQVKWVNPTVQFNDKDIREEYPALEQAWQHLLVALQEYELAKKLIQDHDG